MATAGTSFAQHLARGCSDAVALAAAMTAKASAGLAAGGPGIVISGGDPHPPASPVVDCYCAKYGRASDYGAPIAEKARLLRGQGESLQSHLNTSRIIAGPQGMERLCCLAEPSGHGSQQAPGRGAQSENC